MARRVTTKDKWKTKKWFEILAPKEFGEKVVGETPASEAGSVMGRRMEIAASELATGPRLNQVTLTLEVDKVAGKTAKTKVVGYQMARGYIRSTVRRRRKRVDLVKNLVVDGKKIRIKAITMTLGKSYRNQMTEIQKIMNEVISEKTEGKTLEEIIGSVLSRELQEGIKERAKKVFPIVSAEIRRIEFP